MDERSAATRRDAGSGLARTALFTGLAGLLLPPLAILALILGIVALARGQGRTMAITAIVSAVLGLVALGVVTVAALNAFAHAGRPSGYQAAAIALKSEVFAAQLQFQAGGYVDEDGNGVGESAFFTELSGEGRPGLALLPQVWRGRTPLIHGYRYVLYLPDGDGAAAARGEIRDHSPAAITARERRWIAYAWPDPWGEAGQRAFAITAEGVVLCTGPTANGAAPAWDAALSAGWGSAPAGGWKPFGR